MKKIIFLLSSVFLVNSVALAQSAVCIQKIQFAVSPQGACEAFPTPCDVPETWKKIESCEFVKKRTATEMQKVQERRDLGRRMTDTKRKSVYLEKKLEKSGKTKTDNKMGSGTLTKGEEFQNRLKKDLSEGFDRLRGRNVPNYQDKQIYEIVQYLNPQKGGYKLYSEEKDNTKKTQNNWETATQMRRTGPLKSYNRKNEKTMTEKKVGEENPYWTDPYRAQQKEYHEKRLQNKKEALESLRSTSFSKVNYGTHTRRDFGIDKGKLDRAKKK